MCVCVYVSHCVLWRSACNQQPSLENCAGGFISQYSRREKTRRLVENSCYKYHCTFNYSCLGASTYHSSCMCEQQYISHFEKSGLITVLRAQVVCVRIFSRSGIFLCVHIIYLFVCAYLYLYLCWYMCVSADAKESGQRALLRAHATKHLLLWEPRCMYAAKLDFYPRKYQICWQMLVQICPWIPTKLGGEKLEFAK